MALAEVLKINCSFAKLNLDKTQLREEAGVALAGALETHSSPTELDLRDNVLGEKGGVALAEALEINSSSASWVGRRAWLWRRC